MRSSSAMAEGPVPLSDLEIADRIVRAAATGPPRDREPTIAQLLSAFGEDDPTPAARERVAAALKMAGASVAPDLMTTPADERVKITPPGRGGGRGGRQFSPAVRAGIGAAIIAGLIAIVVVVSHTTKPSNKSAGSALPAGTTATTATTGTAPTTAATTATTTTPATRHRTVTVRLSPTAPGFVCVDDAHGKILFSGTLATPASYTGRHIRVALGLPAPRMSVDGRNVPVTDAPTGYDINIHHVFVLPPKRRPCAAKT
jgi:hypothetical protein